MFLQNLCDATGSFLAFPVQSQVSAWISEFQGDPRAGLPWSHLDPALVTVYLTTTLPLCATAIQLVPLATCHNPTCNLHTSTSVQYGGPSRNTSWTTGHKLLRINDSYPPVIEHSNGQLQTIAHLSMIYLSKIVIFQLAMFDYQRVNN